MKAILRYLCALLAVICLTLSAALALFACVTTEDFAREIGNTKALQALQNQRIQAEIAKLNETWSLSPDVLSPFAENAVREYTAAVAQWWGDLWTDASAELTPPYYLTDAQISDVVSAVRADAGFTAVTDESQRRAIARDEVACALDEAVCNAVFPLRTSLVEIALNLLRDVCALPLLRDVALISAAALAGLGLVMMILARKAAGSAFVATALVMAALTASVWLMDVPGMLAQLNEIVPEIARNALAIMALLWYGVAAMMGVLGGVILVVKVRFGREVA